MIAEVKLAYCALAKDQKIDMDEVINLLLECDELLGNIKSLSCGQALTGGVRPDTNVLLSEAVNGISRRVVRLLEITEYSQI